MAVLWLGLADSRADGAIVLGIDARHGELEANGQQQRGQPANYAVADAVPEFNITWQS